MISLDSKDIVKFFNNQINHLRTNPSSFISILQNRISRFNDRMQFKHSQIYNIYFKTQQGIPAVQSAIEYLKKSSQKPPLTLSYILCQSAYEIGLKMAQQKTIITDLVPYMILMEQSVQKHSAGQQIGEIKMILQYGFRLDKDIIPSMIVDDGDPRRSKRQTLFDPHKRFLGISVHQHFQFDYLVVFLFGNHVSIPTNCQCQLI